MLGATTTSAACAVFVALMASHGIGPFECVPYAERHAALQVFLLTLLAVPLVLASLLAERETSLHALANSERLREAMLRVLPDPTLRCDPHGIIRDVFLTPDSVLPLQENLLGQRMDALADATSGPPLIAALRMAAAGVATAPVVFRTTNGDSVQEARFTRLDDGEVLCLLRDVTAARQAQALLAFEASILELMAQGRSNAQVFAALVDGIEEFLRDGRASLLQLVGNRLYVAYAPHLPHDYNEALRGVEIGPDRGSCGTAAFTGRTVVAADLTTDPRWEGFRELPLQHGLRSCWSVPVRSANGSVLGTFAIYHGEPREPTASELAVVERAATLTGIAIEREQRESLLAAIHDNVVEGIFRSVPGQGLIYANRALARLFGYEDPAALLQATAKAVAEPNFETKTAYGRHLADLRRFATAIPRLGPTELCLHRRDGSTFWGLFSCSPIYGADGRKMACDGALADATARRQLEEQLRQAQKMEAIGKLAGGIAHDFNNLLMAIGGYTAAVREQVKNSPTAVADLDEIQRAADRAAGLTRQLLAFSRQQVLTPQLLDLPKVVDGLGNMLRRLIGEDIDLQIGHLAGPCAVRIDASQLEQVLLNLALNARDAMPTGGVLRLQTYSETVAAQQPPLMPALAPGNYAVLVVQDNGAGMSEAVRARAFDPFFTTKEPGKGTGLGLATVYGIVRQSGGHIELDSSPGHGTTVRIYLPLVATPSQPTVSGTDGLPTPDQPQPPLRILVAEDEPVVRELVLRLLRRAGHSVTGAADGEQALKLAKREPAFDLLVTDVVMPGMNGRELAERMQQLQPRLPVLFMSGYAHDLDGGLPEANGASAFLQKPFDAAALLQRVQSLLQAHGLPTGG
jgi:PAS domain S-box-containing protein